MTFDKFTIKAQEAIQEAVNTAQMAHQQAIEPVHILQGIMQKGRDVTNFVFQKLGAPSSKSATLDHQWIHVDVERAKKESPYKSTIAHGYLTLSLLPHLWDQIVEVNNLKMMVNYGMDKMRFGIPVITGSRIRMKASLANLENLRGITKAYIDFTIEIEGQRKPALKGEAQFLYYFE